MRKRSICALVLAASLAAAHDIPNDVTLRVFFKPEAAGNTARLRVLVRVPMVALRDIDFPETARGFLDLPRNEPLLPNASRLWLLDSFDVFEGETKLPTPVVAETRISLESDKSFTTYEQALAHVTGPRLNPETTVVWNQTFLDVLFEYSIRSERSAFSILPQWARLGVRVATGFRFLPPGGAERVFEFNGDPGLVRLDPRWYQAAWLFVIEGFWHILDGIDHLLFLLCLVIPFRRFRALVPVVTGFTVAHSITLFAAAYNFVPDALWFPPLIETLIALSILYMALENIVGAGTVHRRWMLAFGFGLVHGFGFSFALKQTLQFAGSHLAASLFAFNVGIELGQLLVLVVFIPVLEVLFRAVVAERLGTIIVSAFVAHTAWHWMVERWERLRQFRFTWPEWNIASLVIAMRVAMLVVIVAGLIWAVTAFWKRRRETVPLSSGGGTAGSRRY